MYTYVYDYAYTYFICQWTMVCIVLGNTLGWFTRQIVNKLPVSWNGDGNTLDSKLYNPNSLKTTFTTRPPLAGMNGNPIIPVKLYICMHVYISVCISIYI